MQSLYVDPQVGGYVRVGNKLTQAPSGVVKANMLLLQPLGTNLYMPGGNPLIGRQDRIPREDVVNGIRTCLSPLIVSGDLVSVTVGDYILSATEKAKVTIEIVLPSSSTPIELTWKQ